MILSASSQEESATSREDVAIILPDCCVRRRLRCCAYLLGGTTSRLVQPAPRAPTATPPAAGRLFGVPTSAHHLHDLPRDVAAQGSTPVPSAWGEVLGADPGSAELARRHAQAVVLLADTARDIDALPLASRERYDRYLPAWWRAVVGTDQHWNFSVNNTARAIISSSDLDHLASAADHIEAMLGGTSLAPREDALDRLAADVEDWRTLLDDTPDLPTALAGQLRSQLDHLLWLVEQAPRFGASAAARAADEALGTIKRASDSVRNPDTRKRWSDKYVALITTIGLLTAGAGAAEKALEATAGTVRAIESTVHAVDSAHDALDGLGSDRSDDSAPTAR